MYGFGGLGEVEVEIWSDVTMAGRTDDDKKERQSYSAIRQWKAEMSNILDIQNQALNILDISNQPLNILDIPNQTLNIPDLYDQTLNILKISNQTLDILFRILNSEELNAFCPQQCHPLFLSWPETGEQNQFINVLSTCIREY